jgi:hypothetical protein
VEGGGEESGVELADDVAEGLEDSGLFAIEWDSELRTPFH